MKTNTRVMLSGLVRLWATPSGGNETISRIGFQINGVSHASSEIIAMTTNGKILMIDTKDDNIDNDESKAKEKIG